VVSLDEDFAALFLTLTNFFFCGGYAFAAYFLGFHYSDMDFCICE
jgi:hypothetical protein